MIRSHEHLVQICMPSTVLNLAGFTNLKEKIALHLQIKHCLILMAPLTHFTHVQVTLQLYMPTNSH